MDNEYELASLSFKIMKIEAEIEYKKDMVKRLKKQYNEMKKGEAE